MAIEEAQLSVTETTGLAKADIPLGTKVIRNVMFGVLRYLIVAPIPFVMTPLILHKIGVAGYGTWAVFLAINGLTSLADLGLFGTVSKFVAEYYARKDFPALNRLFNSGLTLFMSLVVIVGSLLWGGAPLFARVLFRGTAVPGSELLWLFRCFQVVIAANILTLLFSSVTSGLQRLDLTNMVSAANMFLSALFSGIFLMAGWGLRGLVYGYIGSAILTLIAYVVLLHRLLPQVAFNPLRCNWEEVRKMFGFSLRLYITQAAVAVHNQVEKVFLGTLVGVAAVGWYDIASDVALKVRSTVGLILTPLLPAASELHALGHEQRSRELYYRAHKYLALIGMPLVCYVAVISGRFVELWIGPSLKIVAVPLTVLVFVNFFNLTTGPGFLMFAGSGNLKPGVQSAILGLVLNVVLSFALIYKYGFTGAVLGTAASLVLASTFFVALFHRQTGYSFGRVLRESYLKPTLCSLLLLALIVAVHPTAGLSWFGLVAMAMVFGALYSVVILLSRFFDEYDWNKMETFSPAVKYVRRMARIA